MSWLCPKGRQPWALVSQKQASRRKVLAPGCQVVCKKDTERKRMMHALASFVLVALPDTAGRLPGAEPVSDTHRQYHYDGTQQFRANEYHHQARADHYLCR